MAVYFFGFAMGVNAACVGEGSRVHSRRGSAPGPEDQKHWFLQTLSSAGCDSVWAGFGWPGGTLGAAELQPLHARARRLETSVLPDIEFCWAGLGCDSVWAGFGWPGGALGAVPRQGWKTGSIGFYRH